MIFVRALLFASGCALIGSHLGRALFAIVFEGLRARDLDEPLAGNHIVDAAQQAGWLLGLAAGAFLFWQWRTLPAHGVVRRWIVPVFGAAGAMQIGYLVAEATPLSFGDPIATMLLSCVAGFLAGCIVMTSGETPIGARLGRAVLVGIGGIAVIFAWLVMSKPFHERYKFADGDRSVWMEVRFPPSGLAQGAALPEPKDIKVELRTPAGVTRGYASEWLRDDVHLSLRASIDLGGRTRERVVTIAVPERPALTFRMPFEANPPPTGNYGGWRKIEAPAGGTGERSEFSVRYMLVY